VDVQRVAHSVGNAVSAEACQQRFCHLQNMHALRGTFSPQESASLRSAVQQHGDRWSKVWLTQPCKQCYLEAQSISDLLPNSSLLPFQAQPCMGRIISMSVYHASMQPRCTGGLLIAAIIFVHILSLHVMGPSHECARCHIILLWNGRLGTCRWRSMYRAGHRGSAQSTTFS